jgi:Ssp1 endopeptidase immunity protein Rap1a
VSPVRASHSRTRRRFALLAVGLLSATGAFAAPPALPAANTVNAEDLAEFCVGSDHVSQNVCRIYILGVTQGLVLGLGASRRTPGLCVPADVTAETLEAAVKARFAAALQANPELKDEDGARFIVALLGKTYPCARPASP